MTPVSERITKINTLHAERMSTLFNKLVELAQAVQVETYDPKTKQYRDGAPSRIITDIENLLKDMEATETF